MEVRAQQQLSNCLLHLRPHHPCRNPKPKILPCLCIFIAVYVGGERRGASLKGVGSGRTGAAHRLGRGRARWRAGHVRPQDLGVHPVPKDGLWPEPGPAYANLRLRISCLCVLTYTSCLSIYPPERILVRVCVCVCVCARACVWACLLCMCVNAYGRAHADNMRAQVVIDTRVYRSSLS